ncbi:hypothetical protein [Mycolicibacterium wolinskyi]|uniref:hypothetical protein n=1 Tax=Mycolicibacterium wolinskyi TaxID=59750 RepID=UPI003917AFAB
MLVVHGVGNQAKGDTCRRFAEALLAGFERVGCTTVQESESADRWSLLHGGRRDRVVFREAYWSLDDAGKRWRLTPRQLHAFGWWLLACLPMLAFLVADGHARVARHPKDRFDDLGLFWRILTALCWIAVPASFFSYVFGKSVGVGILASIVVLAGAIWFLLSPLNVAEQVRIASLGGERLDCIIAKLDAELRTIEDECRKIVIVAHSQGGFLTYELLRRLPLDRVKRIKSVHTIGSGLRGILSMRIFGGIGFTTLMALIALGATCVALFPILDSTVTRFCEKFVLFVGAMVQIMAFPALGSSLQGSAMRAMYEFSTAPFYGALDGFETITITRWIVVAVSIVIYCGMLAYNISKRATQAPVDSVDLLKELKIERWCEYFSVHDIVGRVQSVREIRGMETNDLPGEGSPFGDHSLKHYLSPSSPLPVWIAAEFATLLKVPRASTHLARIENGVNLHRELSRRAYMRRAMTTFNIFAPTLLSALPHSALTINTLAWPLWITLGASIVTHLVGRRASRKRASSIWAPSVNQPIVDRYLTDGPVLIPVPNLWMRITVISTAVVLGAAYYVNGIPGVVLHELTGLLMFYIGIIGILYFAPRFGAGYPAPRVRTYVGAIAIGLLPIGILLAQSISYWQGLILVPGPVTFFIAVCWIVFEVRRKKLLI